MCTEHGQETDPTTSIASPSQLSYALRIELPDHISTIKMRTLNRGKIRDPERLSRLNAVYLVPERGPGGITPHPARLPPRQARMSAKKANRMVKWSSLVKSWQSVYHGKLSEIIELVKESLIASLNADNLADPDQEKRLDEWREDLQRDENWRSPRVDTIIEVVNRHRDVRVTVLTV
ncbi:hypothetical protein CHU98_g3295 [Xylaria longipes]|nr:hypothetical protein CHU98_g3295 [Xylaria longipes]